ncbi:MAG: tRNA lysidine(34) synthetase TilS [Nocardioides sp.]|uniref:tRNA lysidine(34) synthetase TilS n=1 Tax=Nocardioides sp. TaxID=35761 RepID=UPI003F0E8E76
MTLPPPVAAVRGPVRRALAPLDPGTTVVVACSGGADSLALCAATVFEARALGLRVVGATVDHGLQLGSDLQADRVLAQMAQIGVDETIRSRVRVDVAGGRGPEAAAREARYAVLEQMAAHVGAEVVLLGHTLDDQAETVLLGLARGSGGRSIAGMRRGFGPFVRPLLEVRRAQTLAACAAEGIEPWDDPHNDDPGYARVRVRQRVLPVLEEQLGPGITEALARTADSLREDTDLLDDLADEAWDSLGGVLGAEALVGLPDALRRRVLRRAVLAAGAPAEEVTRAHVLSVEALVTAWRGQKWVDLPGHLRAVRRDGVIEVVPAPR